MIACDAIVVGGGPAGSTCARTLTRAGWDVVVLDRAAFPRDKVCAGWVTPEVFRLLDLAPADYAAAGHVIEPIRGFRTGVLGAGSIETAYGDVVSHAIRRCELDAYLLTRSGARVHERTPVTSLVRTAGTWIVNDAFEAPYLVGAGGHFCPVARHLRGASADATPVVAKEIECLASAAGAVPASRFPELFFCDDLDGYGWCVPKGDFLNVGLGRRSAVDFNRHVDAFVEHLAATRGLTGLGQLKWHGHAYLAGGTGWRPLVGAGVVTVGDAAGLAYPESGEGIRPAVESGRLAAEALVECRRTGQSAPLAAYARTLERTHPHVAPGRHRAAGVIASLGRQLMRSRVFTRHVVLDKWFLRRGPAPGVAAS